MESSETRKQFGSRFLNQDDNVFKHNAWYDQRSYLPMTILNKNFVILFIRDNVQWDEEQEQKALESVRKNSEVTLTVDELEKYENDANQFWDAFYDIHQNKFFKDRHWLFTEFPELKGSNAPESNENNKNDTQEMKIFEIGCGVGNTIFPILKYNDDKNLRLYGGDFSSKAIDILQNHAEFDANRCQVFVLDATNVQWDDIVPFKENSIDIIVLIFVLSAIHPDK